MENLILEIHSHGIASINIPVNSDSLIAQEKSDKFCKKENKMNTSSTKVGFWSWMTKETGMAASQLDINSGNSKGFGQQHNL